jgi:hypothetical protein
MQGFRKPRECFKVLVQLKEMFASQKKARPKAALERKQYSSTSLAIPPVALSSSSTGA